jgi:acetyltransferase-like isoleucine patch superfamily enzyme
MMSCVRIGEAALRGERVTITRSPVRPAQLVTPAPAATERRRDAQKQ